MPRARGRVALIHPVAERDCLKSGWEGVSRVNSGPCYGQGIVICPVLSTRRSRIRALFGLFRQSLPQTRFPRSPLLGISVNRGRLPLRATFCSVSHLAPLNTLLALYNLPFTPF